MNRNSSYRIGAPLLIVAAATLAACAAAPKTVPEVERARAQIERVASAPMAREAAAVRLDKAQLALKNAEANLAAKRLELAKHDAYMANSNALIAEQQIAELYSRRQVEQGEAARNRVLIEAREAETDRARLAADSARAQAAAAGAAALSADAQAQQLREELLALQAKQTDRGMVITLGDVLFDTNKAELKPGAMNTVERLASFLSEHGELRVLIEGHTDSRGSADYNLGLSERRAAAVRTALASRGIDGSRIQARGLGKDYPVASNDTREGQQANRRVEIVFSDKQGAFPANANRSPVAGL